MTPIQMPVEGYPEGSLIPYIASLNESWDTWGSPDRSNNGQRTAIEMLPEDVLLEIFDFYRLDAMKQSQGRPWKWHRLAHVCQKWRDLISMSTRRLDLRILCESGVPIGNILASWPTLPIVAILDAGRKSKTVPRNVMAALRCPDRLCEIGLRVTSPMLASIVEVIQKPCQALERIRITVQAPTGPSESMPVCNAFLGGSAPHLSEIKLDGIAFPFPSIRQVLLSTNNLVELHLAKIPNEAYFSPNELVTGLSTLAQLKHLTIDFHFPASSSPPSIAVARPLAQRTTLPSLISLDFHGASGYLEEFVSWIDLPVLCKITAMLFNDIFFEIPEFCKFILRLNALRSPTRVIVKHSMDFVGVFLEEGQTLRESCFLGTSCRQLDWQLSFVTEIISQLSSHLSSVHSLFIQSGEELPTWEDADSTPSQWLELLRPFTHVTQVHVREQLVPRIVEALVAEEMTADVFPELTLLHLDQYLNSASVEKAVDQFVAAREVSGRTVTLTSGDKTLDLAKQLRQRQRERRRQEREELQRLQLRLEEKKKEQWQQRWQRPEEQRFLQQSQQQQLREGRWREEERVRWDEQHQQLPPQQQLERLHQRWEEDAEWEWHHRK